MLQVNSTISLITKSNIRYEGVLVQLKSVGKRLLLKDVKSFGTEGRNNGVNEVPTPAADDPNNLYSLVEFQIPMIKELYVIKQPAAPVVSDPAIVSVTQTESTQENESKSNVDDVVANEPNSNQLKTEDEKDEDQKQDEIDANQEENKETTNFNNNSESTLQTNVTQKDEAEDIFDDEANETETYPSSNNRKTRYGYRSRGK